MSLKRYRVVWSTSPSGGFTEFSAEDDQAAREYAESRSYGARVVVLAEIMQPGDRRRPIDPEG